MSAFDLEELRRLLADATPAPWGSRHCCDKHKPGDSAFSSHVVHWPGPALETLFAGDRGASTDDAAFVAAMRNALPALLAECEAGRKLREAVVKCIAIDSEPGWSICLQPAQAKEQAARRSEARLALRATLAAYDAAVGVE